MPRISLLLFVFFSIFSSQFSLLPAALPHPDPAPLQPLPTASASSSFPAATIPAFPEQSDMSSPTATSSCPLTLPADLVSSISTSCPPARPAALCCPSLAASLYSAFAPAALSLPAAARSLALPDLPDLPDDSESCAGQVEKALRSKGVELPRVNDTCDVAYCYCGVRLRRLTCASGAFAADDKAGKWAATAESGRRLERECRRPGLAGCNRCLRALNQLNPQNVSRSQQANKARDNDRECQLMGLTWLLSKNRTLYLPTATSVLRAYMAVPDPAAGGPASCSVPRDEMPFAVGSDEINGESSAVTVKSQSALSLTLLPIIVLFSVIF